MGWRARHKLTHVSTQIHSLLYLHSVITTASELGEGGGEGLWGVRVLLPLALLRRLQFYRLECQVEKMKVSRTKAEEEKGSK